MNMKKFEDAFMEHFYEMKMKDFEYDYILFDGNQFKDLYRTITRFESNDSSVELSDIERDISNIEDNILDYVSYTDKLEDKLSQSVNIISDMISMIESNMIDEDEMKEIKVLMLMNNNE